MVITLQARAAEDWMRLRALALVAVLVSAARPAAATTIVIDEQGNGFIDNVPLAHATGTDPGPGGLQNVLFYVLPFPGTPGDVRVVEPGGNDLLVSDVLRFNGDGRVFFYSDSLDGFDALADTPGFPSALYPNNTLINEIDPQGNGFALYTAGGGTPGAGPNGALISYKFISDGTAAPVPEPATLTLVAPAVFGLMRQIRRRRGATFPI